MDFCFAMARESNRKAWPRDSPVRSSSGARERSHRHWYAALIPLKIDARSDQSQQEGQSRRRKFTNQSTPALQANSSSIHTGKSPKRLRLEDVVVTLKDARNVIAAADFKTGHPLLLKQNLIGVGDCEPTLGLR